ncbi:MAG: hypothetical protein DHS20C20_09510 [Ardenticatenaceae bacterium]|nr:MAG: hypothetical protein DHS20C20_09510 [Ardenticatenaceae bacterium]
MSTLGLIHTIFGVVALLAGTAVILLRKGTRWHRTLGHIYLTNMLALNISALFIYRLFGTFGPFHWLALISLLTLIAGMVPIFTRRPKGGWLELHASFINGSYVGLVAATAAEIASRLPGTEESFGLVVGGTSFVVIFIGGLLIQRFTPTSIRQTPARFRRAQ